MDAFEIMGIAPSYLLDLSALSQRQRDLSRALHPDKFVGASKGERRHALGRAIEVNEAYRHLRDPLKRADVLLKRLGLAEAEGEQTAASPSFLMEIMEKREELRDAGRAKNVARIEELRDEVQGSATTVGESLGIQFDEALRVQVESGELDQDFEGASVLHRLLGQLRFERRFIDEADLLLDELL